MAIAGPARSRAALLICLCTVGSAGARAEPALDSVVVDAQVQPGGPLMVSMDYFLHPEEAESVTFTALGLEGRRAVNVRAFAGEKELSYRTAPSAGERAEGRIDLPAELRGRDRIRLRLRYEVLPAPGSIEGEATLVLPMLVAGWPPRETGPATFTATVRLPRGLRILDSFPSEYESLDSPDRTRVDNAYRFVLPVVPALVRLRIGDRPTLTAVRALDLGAALVLAGLTLYGWRRVRRHLP